MKITKGKWKARNGKVIEIQLNNEEGYYYDWVDLERKHRLYYDNEGRCYKDKDLKGNSLNDYVRTSTNSSMFANWDLIELVEEEIEVLKRNSNPILTLDLCTE